MLTCPHRVFRQVATNSVEATALLMSWGSVRVDACTHFEESPLHIAARLGNAAMLRQLLAVASDKLLNLKNARGLTAQALAEQYGFKDIFLQFRRKGPIAVKSELDENGNQIMVKTEEGAEGADQCDSDNSDHEDGDNNNNNTNNNNTNNNNTNNNNTNNNNNNDDSDSDGSDDSNMDDGKPAKGGDRREYMRMRRKAERVKRVRMEAEIDELRKYQLQLASEVMALRQEATLLRSVVHFSGAAGVPLDG